MKLNQREIELLAAGMSALMQEAKKEGDADYYLEVVELGQKAMYILKEQV